MVTLLLASGAGMFEGELNNSNTELTGHGLQGGQSIPMTFQRADYRAEHAADAEKDYRFHSAADLPGHWQGTWILPFAQVKVRMRFASVVTIQTRTGDH